MHLVLSLPTAQLVGFLFAFVISGAALALLLRLLIGWLAGDLVRITPVPTFVGVVAASWALALGFAASDIWTLGGQADRALVQERSSVLRLSGVSASGALDLPEMYQAVSEYVRLVESEEWGASTSGEPSPDVDDVLQTMRLAIIELARSDAPQALVGKIVQDFDELQDARNDRLAIGRSLVDEAKWYLVLTLTVLTMTAIVVVHMERPRAGFHALAIFSVVAFSSLWVLALHIHPYANKDAAALQLTVAQSDIAQ